MIVELAKGYRGVLCRWCAAPIPAPATVADHADEDPSGETNATCAFTLRCRACDYENVFTTADIRTLEGEPRRRTTRARAAGA